MVDNTQHPRIEPSNLIKRYLVRTIEEIVPRKTKRLIVVSAAIGLSCHSTEVEQRILDAVNRELHLGKTTDEMKFGIWINDTVFGEAKKCLKQTEFFSEEKGLFFEKLTESDAWRLSANIARAVPFFLCYGTLQLMTVDIHAAIKKLKELFVKSKHPLIV